MLWVGITQDDGVLSTLGAGDAYLAGALKHPDIVRSFEERAVRGSVSGSYAVETIGAHENPPTEQKIFDRMTERPPEVKDLYNDRQRVYVYSSV